MPGVYLIVTVFAHLDISDNRFFAVFCSLFSIPHNYQQKLAECDEYALQILCLIITSLLLKVTLML